jgi:hypothetical protein
MANKLNYKDKQARKRSRTSVRGQRLGLWKPRDHNGTDRDDAREHYKGIKDCTHIPHDRHLIAAPFGESAVA